MTLFLWYLLNCKKATHKKTILNSLSDVLPLTESQVRNSHQSVNTDEEKEITMYRRHKRYLKDIKKVTSTIWCQHQQYESLDVIRDMTLFMSRYETCSGYVATCNECAAELPWEKYRCLECIDLDLCGGCHLSGKRPDGNLPTHQTISLR